MTFSLHQGGVVTSSQITHTQSSKIHLLGLAHILATCALVSRSCTFFTIYPTPLQVITTRAREGGPNEQRAKKNDRVKLIYTRAPHSSFAHCSAASTVIPLLPKATFTPSIVPLKMLNGTYYKFA